MSDFPKDQNAPVLDDLPSYVERLFERGILCLPLRTCGRHIDFSAMGLESPHLTTLSKSMKELVFTSTLFNFALNRPAREDIVRWFSNHDGNVGIVCGYRDLVVLDFDRTRLFQRFRQKHEALLSTTPVAKTPNGFHVYLRCERPYVSSSLYVSGWKAGHLKALGGYVLTSPSRLKNGATYEWLPGQSPLEVEPRTISSLEDYSLRQSSPLKRLHDRIRGRGSFVPG